jgi:hypothetical protein
MSCAINPYVKVLIWASPTELYNAPQGYGHVALETCTGGPNPETTYISYWGSSHTGECARQAHFHHAKEDDDLAELGKTTQTYILSNLNVAKVNAAFKAFQANPNAWGALGWGILGNAYARDCRGLTVFLLERGGIFERRYAGSASKLNTIIKYFFNGFGLFYSAISFAYSYNTGYYFGPFRKYYKANIDYIESHPKLKTLLFALWAHALILAQVADEINETITKNIGQHQLAFNEHLINALDYAEQISSSFDCPKIDYADEVVERHLIQSEKIGHHLLVVASISAVGIVVFNYINNRFISSRYSTRQIRILVEKAIFLDKGV